MLEARRKPETLEELEKADEDIGDLGDAGGDTGGLEDLANAWRFLRSWSQQTTALLDNSPSDSPLLLPHEHNSNFQAHLLPSVYTQDFLATVCFCR